MPDRADPIIELLEQRRVYHSAKITENISLLHEFYDSTEPLLSHSIRQINATSRSAATSALHQDDMLDACGSIEQMAYEMLEFNNVLREIGDLVVKSEKEKQYLEMFKKNPSSAAGTIVQHSLQLQDNLEDMLQEQRDAVLDINKFSFKWVHSSGPSVCPPPSQGTASSICKKE